MITTIQIPIDLKKELDDLKSNKKNSYATVLKQLIFNEKKRRNALLLREYGIKYGEESKDEVNEWIETEIDWEYEDETR